MRPDDTAPAGAVRIPLRARDGSIRAYAIVDAADAEWVNQWRWCLDDGRYAMRNLPRVAGQRRGKVRLHRELLGLVPGDGLEGDHINLDKLDNRRSNLRATSKTGNRQNVPGKSGTSSRFRGVSWYARHQKWRAEVCVDGRRTFLGYFDSEADAARAATDARRRLMPLATN